MHVRATRCGAWALRLPRVSGTPNNIRQHETVIEVTYLYQIAPWWSVQPDLQGVFNPGAALPSSLHIPPRKNSLAIGMRTKIDF